MSSLVSFAIRIRIRVYRVDTHQKPLIRSSLAILVKFGFIDRSSNLNLYSSLPVLPFTTCASATSWTTIYCS
jgi:hypothetical protein